MKKLIPISLVVLLIALVIFAIAISTGDDEITTPTDTNATSTDTITEQPANDVWLDCDDRTRVKVTYGENTDTATLSFHDEVYNLTKTDGTNYVDDAKGLRYSENQGQITINQKGTDAVVTCQVTA